MKTSRSRIPLPNLKLATRSEMWGLPLFLALFAVTFTLLVFLVVIYEELGTNILPFAGVFIFLSAIFWILDPILKERFPPMISSIFLIAVYLVFAQILMLVSGGMDSPFFLVYYFVVFTGAMSYGLTGALVVTALVAMAYATFMQSIVEFPEYLTHIIVLWIISLMVGFLAETKKRVEQREALQNMRLAALEEIARFMRELSIPEDVVDAGLEAALRLLNADAVALKKDGRIVRIRTTTGEEPAASGTAFPIELAGVLHQFEIFRPRQALLADEDRIIRLLIEKMQLIATHLQDRAIIEAARSEKERVLDSIGTAVLTVSDDGEIRTANRRAAEILRLEPAPARPVNLQAPPINGPALMGWGEESREVELHTMTGEAVPVAMKVFAQVDETGAETGRIVVFEDLKEIRRLEAVLRRSEALAALGEMASRVAHEIRNPLGGILGFLGLAEKKAPEDIRKYILEATSAVQRLEKTVRDLLTFARPVFDSRASFKLSDAWSMLTRAEAAARAQDLQPPVLEIEPLTSGLAAVELRGDLPLFEQVMGNLIRNAREAAGAGGHASLRARWGDPFVWIEVDDDGPGCAPEMEGKLFEPFVSSKASGSGLGLAIARRIVEGLNGSIRYLRVTAQDGRSLTRFRLSWPLAVPVRQQVPA